MKPRWTSRDFEVAPRLAPYPERGDVQRRLALLINPFYRKDPRASFGKHVLTPSLALPCPRLRRRLPTTGRSASGTRICSKGLLLRIPFPRSSVSRCI